MIYKKALFIFIIMIGVLGCDFLNQSPTETGLKIGQLIEQSDSDTVIIDLQTLDKGAEKAKS